MIKQNLCLKIKRNIYMGDHLICVFNVEDHANLTERDKEMILNAIETKYRWIFSELSITRDYLKRKLLDNKWQSFEYRNKDFNCNGRLSLTKIDSFGV